jgi:hypothetical protein
VVAGDMISRVLEFRGINRRHLEMYFEELGGKRRLNDSDIAFDSAMANSNPKSDGFPTVFKGVDWEGQILSETEISFTTVIKVNAVHVRFSAKDEAGLAELIKKYRLKTTRVGG